MTAIAITHVTDGFAIAADGLSSATDQDTGIRTVSSQTQQKIFRSALRGEPFAWAVTGTVFNAEMTFDLIGEIERVLSISTAASLSDWTDNVGLLVRDYIDDAQRAGRTVFVEKRNDIDNGSTFAQLFFVGYLRKGRLPQAGMIRFWHEDGVLSDPAIQLKTPPCNLYSGAPEIASRYYSIHPDTRFKRYYRDPGKTLGGAIAHARGYIEACCDPMAMEIDTQCETIGGHIHVATVTRESGFQWFIPPL
jgi:hypothetical protein